MAKKKNYTVGFRKPPKGSRFRAGESGNPKGRPKGSKNLSTAIAKELLGRIPITENGKEKRVSRVEVAAKQIVMKAATGDLRAFQAIAKLQSNDGGDEAHSPLDVFDTHEHHLTMAHICQRIRGMEELPTEIDDRQVEKGRKAHK